MPQNEANVKEAKAGQGPACVCLQAVMNTTHQSVTNDCAQAAFSGWPSLARLLLTEIDCTKLHQDRMLSTSLA